MTTIRIGTSRARAGASRVRAIGPSLGKLRIRKSRYWWIFHATTLAATLRFIAQVAGA